MKLFLLLLFFPTTVLSTVPQKNNGPQTTTVLKKTTTTVPKKTTTTTVPLTDGKYCSAVLDSIMLFGQGTVIRKCQFSLLLARPTIIFEDPKYAAWHDTIGDYCRRTCTVAMSTTTTVPPTTTTEDTMENDTEFQKLVGNSTDSEARFQKYTETRKSVQEHNIDFELGLSSFEMALNKFAVQLDDEIAPLALDLSTLTPTQFTTNSSRQKRSTQNTTVDWRFAMRPIANQGACGGCWAFAMVAMLEGFLYLNGQNDTGKLSVQQLLSCDTKVDKSYGVANQGCNGGYFQVAADYLKAHGERSAIDIPFIGRAHQACKTPYFAPIAPMIATFDSGFLDATNSTKIIGEMVQSLENRVRRGPVAVGMAVSTDIYSYSNGVYDGDCGPKINHAVVIVGFTDDYWIVRNSWGSDWGEDGYFRVKRSSGVDRCKFLRYWSQATEIGEDEQFVELTTISSTVSTSDPEESCDCECDCEDDEEEEEEENGLYTSTTLDTVFTTESVGLDSYYYDDYVLL